MLEPKIFIGPMTLNVVNSIIEYCNDKIVDIYFYTKQDLHINLKNNILEHGSAPNTLLNIIM